MDKYMSPDGFIYDENSGMYYKKTVEKNEYGQDTQWVIWFNANTGEYIQQSYPQEQVNESVQENYVPEGFFYDSNSGLYYKNKKAINAQGYLSDYVTWYYPETGDYQEVEYPTVQMPAEQTINSINLQEIKQKKDEMQRNETQRNKTNKSNRSVSVAIIIALVLIAANVIFASIYTVPLIRKNMETNTTETSNNDISQNIVNEEPSEDEFSEDVSLEIVDEEAMENIQQSVTLHSEDTYVWPDFPHANIYYMMADEDENYAYALHQNNNEWKYVKSSSLTSAVYRMPKNNIKGEWEKILSVQRNGQEAIATFTVAGDYIYYSVKNSDMDYDYYRIPKNGGKGEYLFSEAFSYMQVYDNILYLLIRDSGKIGYMSTKSLVYNTINDIPWMSGFGAMGGAHENFNLLTPFSVCEGKIYLGGMMNWNFYYGTYDLQTGEIDCIQIQEYLGDDPSYWNCDIYGLHILFFDNANMGDEYGNCLLARLGNDLVAYGMDYVVDFYKIPDQITGGLDTWEYCEENYGISIDYRPYAVTSQYLFYADKVYICDEYGVEERDLKDYIDCTESWQVE